MSPLDFDRDSYWMVVRRDGIEAEMEKLFLDGVNLRDINADGRQYGATIFFLNTDQI